VNNEKEKYTEGDSCSLIWNIVPAFDKWTEKRHESNNRFLGQDINPRNICCSRDCNCPSDATLFWR